MSHSRTSAPVTKLKVDDLRNIVRGACFLASGGGGSYQTGMKLADHFESDPYYKEAYGRIDHIDVINAKALKEQNGKTALVVAGMGAPAQGEGIVTPELMVAAVKKMEELNGRVDYILPIEIGAANSAIACLAAAKLGIPVVDADGAGRAVPTLDLLTYAAHGISVNPTVLAGKNSETRSFSHVVFNISADRSDDAASKIEALARPVVSLPDFDGTAGLAFWFIDDVARLEEDFCVPGTLTLVKDLGEKIIEKVQSGVKQPDPQEILEFFENQESIYPIVTILCEGTLKEVSLTTSGGFDLGIITIEGKEGRSIFKIIVQNESLLLWDSERPQPLAMAPDLITYLVMPKDHKPGEPCQWVYTNADIMDGNALKAELRDAHITVMGLQAPRQLRESETRVACLRRAMLQRSSFQNGTNPLPEHFMNILNGLNYYGAYLPIEDATKKQA